MAKIAVAQEEYHIPPYFDRYQEEREKRYQANCIVWKKAFAGTGIGSDIYRRTWTGDLPN